MKNVIIGTAGHIDHGKTTLIKALTGIETDRLKEEKKRGITIELGFAHFDLPSNRRAGIIDVPGHERFIKNMLAGVGGIDIVLLVIAADEGIMPQTQEHLDILSILEVNRGIVVITKIDLVDQEWLELVEEEIRKTVEDTFLENAPIMPVSAMTGKGLSELMEMIDKLTEETEEKDVNSPFRLPIDRVFTIAGFGTVVTGTQIEGIVKEGENVTIYPSETQAKVRNLQVHGSNVSTSFAGQRVAINLAGIKKEHVQRGEVLAASNSMQPTMMLDTKLRLLKSSNRSITNRDRLRLYHGTSEIFCRVVLLDLEELNPGESCYAQLRLEEEIVAKRGDHFVIRFYSPMETIGGGIILETNPIKHKRFNEDALEELKIKEAGNPEEIIEKMIKRHSESFENITFFVNLTGLSEKRLDQVLRPLVQDGSVVKFVGNIFIHRDYIENIEKIMVSVLNEYHKRNPFKAGMLKEELRSRVLSNTKGKLYDDIVDYFVKNGIIKIIGIHVALSCFEVEYTPYQEKIKHEIEKIYIEGRYNTPSLEEMLKNVKDPKSYKEIFDALVEMNRLVKLTNDIVIHVDHYDEAKDTAIRLIRQHGELTLAQFRDNLGTTRKYALPLLEKLDQDKITKRIEDKRILY